MVPRLCIVIALAACGDNVVATSDPAPPGDASGPAVELPLHPTYAREVAPILAARCAGCHVTGGVAPFPLTTHAEASALSEAIAAATTARVMPPWPADASGACNTFVEPRWLRDDEIAILAAWHADGAPLGDPGEGMVVAVGSTPTPFTPALALASDVAYQVRPGPDEYRCFVIDPGLAADRFITAIAMQLDRADVVHHMQLYAAVSSHGEQVIDERDAADPGPGYTCGDEGVGPLRYVGVWAGGDLIRRWPDGTGIRIEGGHRLVLQFHYHNHGGEPVFDRSAVALELADAVAHEGRITSVQATGFELAPQQESIAITKQGPLPITGPEKIRGARVHMHDVGASARMELVRDGQTRCVLDIPRWDVGWQLFYRFAEPLDVEVGDQIKIRCTYDTQSQTAPVVYGLGSDEEMCIAYTFLSE